MKQILTNPIMINVELSLFDDIVKVIGNAIHSQLNGNQVQAFLNHLNAMRNKAIDDDQNKGKDNA